MHRIISLLSTLSLLLTPLIVSSGAQAQSTECFFTGALDSLALYHAPLTHATQLKDKLPGGVTYRVQSQNGEHFLITVDHAYGGWVDRRSGTLSGDCDNIPVDTRSLRNFPTVCLLTTSTEVQSYYDEDLSTPHGTLPAGHSFAVVEQANTANYVLLDHATGVWVSTGSGTLSGSCQPHFVYALANARLWSRPDVKFGQVLATLEPGSMLTIVGDPVTGPIRQDTDDTGIWYPVQQGPLSGWVWSDRLTPYVQRTDGPTALANARVWTQPNVHGGQVLATLRIGQEVTILSGPVLGPISFDTPVQGNWYEVQANNITGWVWSERLALP